MPRPGLGTTRYGGNTTCVEFRLGNRLFLVDAGSGIEAAGRAWLDSGLTSYDVLFSHLHHDHISGLPFFAPALKPGVSIRTYCGNLNGQSAEAALDRMFAPPLFPVTLSVLPCSFSHAGFKAGETLTFDGDIAVRTFPLPHPGGATAYRFTHGDRVVCFVSDIEHVPGVTDPALAAFCEAADLVIYDSMFSESEFTACRGWGHSTWAAGVALCRAAGAKALAATHHHLRHDDAALDRVHAELRKALPGSFVAREGKVIRLGAIPRRRVSARHAKVSDYLAMT